MSHDLDTTHGYDRRKFLALCSATGVGSTLLPGVLWAKMAESAEITAATIACAEDLAGVKFTDEKALPHG